MPPARKPISGAGRRIFVGARGKVSAPAFRCRPMLVPLDGQAAHEQGLEPAAGLARACRAAVHVLGAGPTLGTLSGEGAATGQTLPGTTAALLELDEDR